MKYVPKTDEEAKIAIFHGRYEHFARIAYALYKAYRNEKMSIIDAYEETWQSMIGK